jgi:hypothetical protein
VLARSLQGHIKFEEGFNSSVRTTAGTSTLAFGAGRGSGQGEPTEEVPVFPGEQPPAGSQLLTGGPRCDELISSINGVPGPVVSVLGGIGVDVGHDTEMPHTLVVAVTLQGLAVCDEFEDEEP